MALQRHQGVVSGPHASKSQGTGPAVRPDRRHQDQVRDPRPSARAHPADRQSFLKILERPDIPLHTNGSENDIRSVVTRRKISGGTHSDQGRAARDTMLSMMKTCNKLGVSFWDYLGDRLGIPGVEIPPLPDLVADLPNKPSTSHRAPIIAPPQLLTSSAMMRCRSPICIARDFHRGGAACCPAMYSTHRRFAADTAT